MIYNDGTSELQIRLHIAEMLKDKVEQDNYNELCEKAFIFVTNGIDLPKVKKNPLDEAVDMLAKSMKQIQTDMSSIDIIGETAPPKKESELKKAARRWQGYCFTHQNHLCYICGYSDEFNCLIAGTYEDCEYADVLGNTDVFDKKYNHYFYIPLDDKFKA